MFKPHPSWAGVLLVFCGVSCHGEVFTAPYSGNLYLKCVGGNAGAQSIFGVGTTSANFVSYLTGLPSNCPTAEALVGPVTAGQTVPFGVETSWSGRAYWAFSTANDQGSAVSFGDLCNNLGMGGKILQQTTSTTWLMHVNDAAHYSVDRCEANNLLIEIRVVPTSAITSGPERPRGNQTALTPAEIFSRNSSALTLIVSGGDSTVSLGSGFFIDRGQAVVTNFHVIAGARAVFVKTGDGQFFSSDTVYGYDAERDLAILKVSPVTGRAVPIGDSDSVAAGASITVIGNPNGLEQTVSNGLISGIRTLEGRRLFQISAPISHGSSGAPVFDDSGKVIGVVVSSLEDGQNLNFAIPINTLTDVLATTHEAALSSLPVSNATRTTNAPQPTPPNGVAPPPIVEYGDVAELRGVRSIFLYGLDAQTRIDMLKEFAKHPGIRIAGRVEEADVVALFGAAAFSMGDFARVWTDPFGGTNATAGTRYGVNGQGYIVRLIPPNTARVIWEFSATRTSAFQRQPSTNFARDFIAVWEKANP